MVNETMHRFCWLKFHEIQDLLDTSHFFMIEIVKKNSSFDVLVG